MAKYNGCLMGVNCSRLFKNILKTLPSNSPRLPPHTGTDAQVPNISVAIDAGDFNLPILEIVSHFLS
ncbi:hypothetical protein PISMIDRAFT_20107 [Pisolithus microcarpus 441]|uniref:Unplaced genomic scaffold scaffold_749, whole genome shotgun sequence n=1 Tax=Pisolithus microcarpus 441 TaxID=765257 RepID=A0A0C9Y9Q2_9AGAM|nr:hypothetical protein PISMIDRAFT_20107 [Pisolithus microcarpus 441]